MCLLRSAGSSSMEPFPSRRPDMSDTIPNPQQSFPQPPSGRPEAGLGGEDTLRDKSVVVVDMVGYSTVARLLEENGGPAMVAQLNRQIQQMMDAASAQGSGDGFRTIAQTGDGAILMFNGCEEALHFATAVHRQAEQHNKHRTSESSRRTFRIGIAFGDVTCERLGAMETFAGVTISNAVRLQGAALERETVVDVPTFEHLSGASRSVFRAQQTIRGKRDEVFRVRRTRVRNRLPAKYLRPGVTRRAAIFSIAAAGAAVATGSWYERGWLSRAVHRLPQKRFVALLNWPVVQDAAALPMISGLVRAIGNELTRAEMYDRDLLVISDMPGAPPTSAKQLSALRDRLGTNLVLGVSGGTSGETLRVALSLYEAATMRVLRETALNWPRDKEAGLPGRTIQEAASLLNVEHLLQARRESRPSTQSSAAYAAFQAGETLRHQSNDAGLEASIRKYQEALELDPAYAEAQGALAGAYYRLYVVKSDPGALGLARDNARRRCGWTRTW